MSKDNVQIPVSKGEIVDKYTILLIKKERISSEEKLKEVMKELDFLHDIIFRSEAFDVDKELNDLIGRLLEVNESLWDIEDKIRLLEKNKDFSDEFVQTARQVYFLNDKRFAIKSEINSKYGSFIKEQKSYEDYNEQTE